MSPDNFGWRTTLGQILIEAGRTDEAVAELDRAARIAPESAKVQILLGRALAASKSPSEAASAFRKAAQLDSKSVIAWESLGRLAREQGETEVAREAFAKVLVLRPDHVPAHLALAELAAQGDDRHSEAHHRGIVADLKADHAPSQVLYANSLMKVGRYAEARKRYLRVAEIRPDNTAASAVAEELTRWIANGRPQGGVVSVDYYDAVYESSIRYSKDGSELDDAKHFRLICDLLEAEGTDAVLDLGCGPGQFAQYLRSRMSIPYIGIDYSPIAIRSALDRSIPGTDFHVLDIIKADLPHCSPTTSIVCTEVLEHVLEDLSLIEKFPVGILCYCSVPSFHTFGHVRHFESQLAVKQRYSQYFDDFSISELPIGVGKNRLYVFSGRRNSVPAVNAS